MVFKHKKYSILKNFSAKPINPLEMRGHVNLSIGIVGPIEKWRFTKTMLHVAIVDHTPIKVE
jgi:hypothetical protein